MQILERWVQNIREGQWAAWEALDRKMSALEGRHQFTPKRRYRLLTGNLADNTVIVEREWNSFAAFEAAYDSIFRDPEYPVATADLTAIIDRNVLELYMTLPT